jgi:hypothetical protein
MSKRFQGEGLELIQIPKKFPEHWQKEAMRLRDLAEVLYCSLKYKDEGKRGVLRGDDVLAEHIKDSLETLWVEIEQVTLDGFWQPRSWEKKPWETKDE